MDKLPSSKFILFFLFLGFFVGIFLEKNDNFLGINFYNTFELIATIFINSLKMIVVPLIMSSLIYSISSFSSVNDISGIGFKAILFYLFSSFAAIIIGIFAVNLIQPGLVNGEGASNLVGLNSNIRLDTLINSQDSYSISSFLL